VPIPASLLDAASQHPCFSGVYDEGHRIQVHQDPTKGPIEAIDFQCEDCLSFRLGCLASDLPQGVSHAQAAQLITEHVRRHRGYALSVGGYHTSINGWLSAVYWDAAGLFALHADRGSGRNKPALDVLIQAMQKGLIKPSHPAMLDPHQYVTQEVFLSVVPPPTITTMAALLASSHVAPAWQVGYCRVTLAEFLPVARAQPSPAVAPAPPPAPPPLPALVTPPSAPLSAPLSVPLSAPPSSESPRVAGERCSVCGEIMTERWLFSSTYIGCGCD